MESNYFWTANGTDSDSSMTAVSIQSNKYIQSSTTSQQQEAQTSNVVDSHKSPASQQVSSTVYTRSEGMNDGNQAGTSDPSMPIEISTPDAIEPKPRTYTCRICQMTFPNKSAVTVHSRQHTDHQGKPYRCSFCDKGFSTNFYLKQHERIHSGQKPYKCPMCEQSFKQLSHVQQHVRTHTGVRPYKCHWPNCGKAFLQQSHLKSHEARHTPKVTSGEKPFKCHWPDCGKSFGQLTNLKSHVARHTPGKSRSRKGANAQKKAEEDKSMNNSSPVVPMSLQDVINQAAAAADIVPTNDVPDEAEIRPYLCPGCSKVYVREATFKKHLEECKTKLQLSISATASALGIDPPATDVMLDPLHMTSEPRDQSQLIKKEDRGSLVTFTTESGTENQASATIEAGHTSKQDYMAIKEEPNMTITGEQFTSSGYKQGHVSNVPVTVESTSQSTIMLHYADRASQSMNSTAAVTNSSNPQMHAPGNYMLSHTQPNSTSNPGGSSNPDDVSSPREPPSTEHSTINQAAIQWQWDQPVPRLNFP